MDPINKIRSLFGSSKATKNAQSQEIKDEVVLILGTKSDTTNPAKAKLDAVTRGLIKAQELMNSGQDQEKLEVLCQELEKLGPSAIHDALKKLSDISIQYSRKKFGKDPQKVERLVLENLIPLQESYIKLYALFSDIRSEVQKKGDNRFEKAHASLSRAMLQPSERPSDPVSYEVEDPSLRSMAKTVLTSAYARKKLKEGLGLWVNGLLNATKIALKNRVVHEASAVDISAVMNKAKTTRENCFAALGQVYGFSVFNRDLIAASRNIVNMKDIKSAADISMAKKLVEKMKANNTDGRMQAGVDKLEVKAVHIDDGVCAGLSLDLSLQALRAPGVDFRAIGSRLALGATPEAHAHQAVYESLGGEKLILENITDSMNNQQKHALDPIYGQGIYQANYENVAASYRSVVFGDIDFNSPLSRAVEAVKKNQRGKNIGTMTNGQFYIKNAPEFKEAVLRELEDKGGLSETAKNELEWLMANLEVRFMFQFCQGLIEPPFVTSGNMSGEQVKNDLSMDSILSCVPNEDIRKNLKYMINKENHFSRYQAIAKARGAKLVRMEEKLGCGIAAKNDEEVLDKMNDLEDGSYVFSIALNGSGHAMQFYKKGDEQYLFDPNLGLINCSGKRHKEQISKLLKLLYPSFDVQGPNSEGRSHNITLTKVELDENATDLLAS